MEPLLEKDFSILNSVNLKLEIFFFLHFHVLSSQSYAVRKHAFRVGHCLADHPRLTLTSFDST